jgi:glycosyltransferase involved in cell wall biosynthesis
VPFFTALAATPDFEVAVAASHTVAGCPDSVPGLPAWADLEHRCFTLFQRVFWQRGMRLPAGMGPGDVLVVGGNPRFVSNLAIFETARSRGIGTVWWCHLWSATSVAWRARMRHALMRRATVTLLYTDDEVARLKALYPTYPRPVVALNNTIDSGPARDAVARWGPERLAEFQRRHGLDGKRLLLFCGRLRSNPSTELDVALKAFALLYGRDASWRFAIIGSGEEEPRYRSLERELGISSGVLWIGPLYDEESLAPWFLTARYFVYPGPIGLGLLQAFAYGLPAITHDERAIHAPEFAALRDGVNGMVFKRGDSRDLARKLESAIADPETRERMSAEALRTATTNYSLAAMVERFATAIRLASQAR